MDLDNRFVDIIPDYARGYFGQRQVDVPFTTSSFDGFNNIIAGNLDVDQVDVELEIVNGVGVDAQATIQQLSAVNSNSGQIVNLSHSIIGNTVNLSRANDIKRLGTIDSGTP